MKPIIKKRKDGNRYLLTPSGYWIRDFTQRAAPVDINRFTRREDHRLLRENELEILSQRIPDIGDEYLPTKKKCLIVSNGYNFKELKKRIVDIPQDVFIIGVNRSLANWRDEDKFLKKAINLFIVNNPYKECLDYLPKHHYYPNCLISIRTFPEFASRYKGSIYYYRPALERHLHRRTTCPLTIDDYRNPICAAIGLTYKLNVEKLALFCCDDSFPDYRPASVQLKNGLWMYPQHQTSYDLIEGNIYWLKQQKDVSIDVINCSSGPEIEGATTKNIDETIDFFS